MKRASLILAVLLQVLPVARVTLVSGVATPAPLAIVFTWLAGAAVLLGGYDAVSGASASVLGVVKYSGTTIVGMPTNYVVEPIGQPFKYRIIVSNPGIDIDLNYFDCIPVPPGLTIDTNLGAAGYITGTPSAVGFYDVTLVAGNLNYPTPSTLPATFVIFPTNTPPAITNQPSSRSILSGSNVTFSVGVNGSFPLAYQWARNGTPLAGRTSAVLSLTNVTSAQAGDYGVVVTNSFGSITSAVARLTVREPFLIELRLGGVSVTNDTIRFQVTGPIYTNYVIWRSPDLSAWVPIKTNWVVDGFLEFTDPDAPGDPQRFYRASLAR